MQPVRIEAQQATTQSAPPKPAIPFWMWAGVAALFIFSLYSAWNAKRLRIAIRATNERAAAILKQRQDLEAQLENAKREAVILTDPASVKIALSPQDPAAPQLEATWHFKFGIVLTGRKVPEPSGNRVLQLWLIPKEPAGKPIPSLTLHPDADGEFVLLVSSPPELITQTKALAITEEPQGGSPQPTTAPRWVGSVR